MTHDATSRRVRAACVAIVALYLAVRLPLLAVPLDRDEGTFGVIGQAILRGELPYRDITDHKPPGAFYLFAAALLVVPPTAQGVHAFVHLWSLATLACLAAVARRLGGHRAALWSAFFFAIIGAAPSIQGFSASTEMLLLLPLLASWRTCLRGLDQTTRRRRTWMAVSGTLGAAACWIKQPAALALLIVPLGVIVHHGRSRWRAPGGDLVWWLAGGLAVSALVTVPFAVAGLWREFWYWAFTHSMLYGQMPVTHWVQRLTANGLNVVRDMGFVLGVGIIGGAVGVVHRFPNAWVGLAFLVLSVVSALHSRFFYAHYFVAVAPAAALAGGLGLAWLHEAYGKRYPPGVRSTVALLTIVLTAGIPLVATPWYWFRPDPVEVLNRTLGRQGFEAGPLVARYVRERTRADEQMFVYGSEPEVSFEAQRRDINPYVLMYPVTWPWPRHREFQERLWAAFERLRPTYLLLPRTPFTIFRTPLVDPFLEQHLNEVGRRDYHLESVVLYDADRNLRFQATLSDDERQRLSGSILYEIWRRNESS